jgi:hypothetical protein
MDDLIDHPALVSLFLSAVAALRAGATLSLPGTLHWTLHVIS